MNSVCSKVLGDFARSVLHHHRAVADPDHAIFGNEHSAEQDPGIRPDADRSTHHRGGRHAGAGVDPPCLAVPPAGPGLPRMLGRTPYGTRSSPLPCSRRVVKTLPSVKVEAGGPCRAAAARKAASTACPVTRRCAVTGTA